MITDITYDQGYTTGGQNVTINGYGFTHSDVSVMIDDVECEVTSRRKYSISCRTGTANVSATEDVNYVGQHGARMKFINNSVSQEFQSIWDYATLDNVEEALALSLEALPDYNTYSYYLYTGWFKAPATTNYRFYGGGDDWVRFSFSNVSNSKDDLIE
jgi:hypothetical protein